MELPPLEDYRPYKTRDPSRRQLIKRAAEIADVYGGNLTLRQLYYQLVAQGDTASWTTESRAANSQAMYRWVTDTLAKARRGGASPLDALLDRGRSSREGRFTLDRVDPDAAMARALEDARRAPQRLLARDRWLGQPLHVSVWVEKDALTGVFEEPCERLGVSWYACKGYSSVSGLWEWVQQVHRAFYAPGATFETAVILYFGDHDPEGFDIPGAALGAVRDILGARGWATPREPDADLRCSFPDVELHRIGLTMEQVREHQPPPQFAKAGSSRRDAYVQEFGERCWELDALPPPALVDLIETSVGYCFRPELHKRNQAAVAEAQGRMREQLVRRGLASERERVAEAIRQFPDASSREIARRLGVSHTTVNRHRRSLERNAA